MDTEINPIKLYKEHHEILKGRTKSSFDKKFKKQAIDIQKRLKEIENQNLPFLKNILLHQLSQSYYIMKNYKDCFDSLYIALSEYPNSCITDDHILFFLTNEIKESSLSDIKKSFEKKNNFASHVIISIISYLKRDSEDMEIYLKKAIGVSPPNPYLDYYLAECYKLEFRHKEALQLYDRLYPLQPKFISGYSYYIDKSECYFYLALDCWRKGDLNNAQEFLRNGIKLYYNIKTKLKTKYRKSKEIYDLVITYMDFPKKHFILFSEIILLDSKFSKIFEAKTFFDLFSSLSETVKFMKNLPMFSTVIKNKKERRMLASFIMLVGTIKRFCILSLSDSLEFLLHKKNNKELLRNDFSKFEEGRKILLDCGFMKGKQAIDAVENFTSEISRSDREEIISRESELIKLLKPAYVLDGELSRYMVKKELEERNYQSLKDFIQQEEEKTKTAIFEKIEDSLGSFKTEIISKKVEKKEPKVEKGKYIIFLSHTSGIGMVRKEETEKSIQKDYLKDKVKYDIFIYGRTVYKKIKNKIGTKIEQNIVPIDLDENVFNLLLIFLIYKDKPIFALPLYNKAWEGSPEYKDVESAVQIMNDLKQTVSQLRLSFEDIEGFDIPRARGRRDKRGGTYFLRGKFKFCVIIEKSSINNYILPGEQ